jgi:ribosomal protein S18 acetylase RimI-like enzyme
MSLKIREAFENDYFHINHLVMEVHNLHVENRPDVYVQVDTPLMREQFEDLLNAEDTKLFVVEDTDNKELLAYSIVKIMTPRNMHILTSVRFAYIDDFCVKSSYKRKGIGRMLFEYILDCAKTEGVSSIQLVVWEFNKDAIEFYESLGMSTRNRRMELNI